MKSTDPSVVSSGDPLGLATIYGNRFAQIERYRNEVWKLLTREWFPRWIPEDSTVLDLGCGYGEFINNITAEKKYGMDLNPSTKSRLLPNITLFEQDCSMRWPLEDECLDVVFSSNFFEHLPDKTALEGTLAQAFRCLRKGGRLVAMGPNIRYCGGSYWDFFDHHIALSERSLSEVLQLSGFSIESSLGKFLPYSMSQGWQPPLWLLWVYLRLPIVWRFAGKQFLVVARKA